MPFAGDFTPGPSPGETQPFSLDMTAQLVNGDTIPMVPTITATLVAYEGVDADASSWLIGSPYASGNILSQVIGGAMPNGLQPGVTYRLTFTVTTTQNKVLVNYAHIACAALA